MGRARRPSRMGRCLEVSIWSEYLGIAVTEPSNSLTLHSHLISAGGRQLRHAAPHMQQRLGNSAALATAHVSHSFCWLLK